MAVSIYLTKEELKTHLYPEVLETISRADDTIVEDSITDAIREAQGYLNKYDLAAMFGTEANGDTEAVPPTFTDAVLKRKVKAVAVWNIVQLANPNIDMAVVRTGYEDAVRWLKDVQRGQVAFQDWPFKPAADITAPADGNSIEYVSRTKRNNYDN